MFRFQVHPQTGVLFVDGSLDREIISVHSLLAEAVDGGGLSSATEIHIDITDVNDNRPLFQREDYEGAVMEGRINLIRRLSVLVMLLKCNICHMSNMFVLFHCWEVCHIDV